MVYRVALALIKSIEPQLLAADFEKMMGLFRSLPKLVDADAVMQVAFAIPLKRAHILAAEQKYQLELNGSGARHK